MVSFPYLKTGAVAQFPSKKNIDYSTDVLQFVDGKEQRFRSYRSHALKWIISLKDIDEGEVQNIRQFIAEQAGMNGTFSFTDPWDGTVYENCSFDSDEVVFQMLSHSSCQTEIIIRNNSQ